MTARASILMLCGLAIPAMPVAAQPADPSPYNSLTSINNGEVSASNTQSNARIDGGEFNSISVSAQGAQSSVSALASIAPDPTGSAQARGDGDANMIVGTTSSTTNNGSVSAKGSFAGAVNFGDRNSMSISATGAATSYSISTSTPGSTPGSTVGN